jgi:hypothetical protein
VYEGNYPTGTSIRSLPCGSSGPWESGGAPSVEDLDRRYGAAWRQTQAERQYYSMRKTLIDEIKERTLRAGDGDPGRVVRAIEESRLPVHPPPSIDKVIKTLRAAKKARAADSYSL